MQTRERKDLHQKVFLCVIVAMGLVSIIGATPILGQEAKFPSKPIEIIVPFGPGGIIDVGTRIIADSFSKELKVPVVIQNTAGGAGLTGATAFLNTKPDGYTLLSASGAAVISTVQLSKTPAFDPRKDLLPVAYIADAPCAMSVHKNSPFKSFDDFLKFAKSNPGKLKGGVSSLGGETHIMFLSIVKDSKIETKLIPYPATGQLVTAILGEHLDWMTLSLPATMPYAKSGDVRILLLTRRSPELPGVPSGPDVGLSNASVSMWMGFFALPQTPKVVYDRLVSAVSNASKDPEVSKKLASAGFNVAYRTPQEFSKLLNEQWEIFSKVIKESDMKVD
jgi:tripartite-type tricarboxylate transporter receptor subunit TctC